MAKLLMLLPTRDFDPTESGIPWKELTHKGHEIIFATPTGAVAEADSRMLNGDRLGPWKNLLRARTDAREAYAEMAKSRHFQSPLNYSQAILENIDGLLLPGGHAPGMKEYLESEQAQFVIRNAFDKNLPVGAICHGVIAAARAKRQDGKSVLFGKTTTALTKTLELSAWAITPWLGSYYRTYPITVEDEVRSVLEKPDDFKTGPALPIRDTRENPASGFFVKDGNYISARWPGDAYRFTQEFSGLFQN